MTMIKKILFVVGLAVVLLQPRTTDAQERSYQGEITVVPVRIEQRGDSLHVDLDVRLFGVQVKSPLSIEMTPCLVTSDRKMELPPVTVKGRAGFKAYERSLALEGKTVESASHSMPDVVLKGYDGEDGTIRYRYVLRYERWMADARVVLQRHELECGYIYPIEVTRLADRITLETVAVEPEPIVPRLAFARPAAEEVKRREMQAEVRLDFMVNQTAIDPVYMNNPRELTKIREIISELKNDPSISINRLEIIGYASPEGTLAGNRRLSEGRAIALRDYLASQFDFPRSAYQITFGGENWDGLVKALETYQTYYKDEVLSIIAFTPDDQQRKNRLKNLQGGAPYREMLRTIYPGLRTAVCVVDYVIKGFELGEAVEVFKTRPQNLSLNEMYLVANTLDPGSQAFIDVFDVAVRMYPEDETANLNAAIAALQNGNQAAAERYLQKVGAASNLPEYNNAMGALAVLKNDFTAAGRFFRMAADAGLEAAKLNLNMLPSDK